MLKLSTSVSVANSLVRNLSRLDGAGYDLSGAVAEILLSNLALTGKLDATVINGYIVSFNQTITKLIWLNEGNRQKARSFAVAVQTFNDNPTEETAEAVINFS